MKPERVNRAKRKRGRIVDRDDRVRKHLNTPINFWSRNLQQRQYSNWLCWIFGREVEENSEY